MYRNLYRLTFAFCMISLSVSAQKKVPGKGRIEHFAHFPSSRVEPRNVDVWVPDDYPKSGPYNVIYMHDGQNLFDSASAFGGAAWKADEAAAKLQRDKKVKPFIIVAIHNTSKRFLEYMPQAMYKSLNATLQKKLSDEYQGEAISDDYLLFIVKELKPVIDNSYYTNRTKEGTAIAGSSMGGLISLYAICEYPNVFGTAGCISTHWPVSLKMNDARIPKAMKAYLMKKLPSPTDHRIYFDHGTATLDKLYAPYQKDIDALMVEKGYGKKNYKSKVFEGAEHNEKFWQARLPEIFKFLMPK